MLDAFTEISLVISVIPRVLDAFTEIEISRCLLQARAIRLARGGPSPQMLATTRSTLLLALLPGLAATDNAICKVLSPLIDELTSKTPLTCSCVSDGTGLNIGGDAECSIKIGPPPLDALKDMKIEFHAGTTVRPCATPATASVEAGITLPVLSSEKTICSGGVGACPDTGQWNACGKTCTSLDDGVDTMVSTALVALDNDDIAYDSSTNKITVTLSAEAGITKEREVPIQKWGVADFFAKVSLSVEGSISGLTTTQAVDLCMKEKVTGTEICGAEIPKCDGTDDATGAVGAAQKAICLPKKINWHELFGAPPTKMFPPQEMKFTDACAEASSASGSSSSESSDAGAIAGAVISVVLFIGTIATVVYLVKKERIANPLDRLKEKLGMKKMPIAPEKGATELPTAAPA